MIGTVDSIAFDGSQVTSVKLRLPPPRRGESECVLDVLTHECVGQGSFGIVYRASCEGYKELALKIATGKASRLRQELDVLSKVCTSGHVLLPRFEFGAMNKAENMLVVGMELCFPKTLHDFLLTCRLEEEPDMLFIAYQVVQAVAAVHKKDCIHRDVKLQNYVFDLVGNVKLIDYGLASNTTHPSAGDVVAGTVSFMAPEMARNALISQERRVSVGVAADVWSAGIVIFSIFTRSNPYPFTDSSASPTGGTSDGVESFANGMQSEAGKNSVAKNMQLLRRVANGDWRWPASVSVSPHMQELVKSMLVKDPAKRPSLEEILELPLWKDRNRFTPKPIVDFLRIPDDSIFNPNVEHLLHAVEEKSADVIASRLASRRNSPTASNASSESDESKEGKFITGGNVENSGNSGIMYVSPTVSGGARLFSKQPPADVTGVSNRETPPLLDELLQPVVPQGGEKKRNLVNTGAKREGSIVIVSDVSDMSSHHVYDIRNSGKKRSKPIRDISVVIAAETEKKTISRKGSRASSKATSHSHVTSRTVSPEVRQRQARTGVVPRAKGPSAAQRLVQQTRNERAAPASAVPKARSRSVTPIPSKKSSRLGSEADLLDSQRDGTRRSVSAVKSAAPEKDVDQGAEVDTVGDNTQHTVVVVSSGSLSDPTSQKQRTAQELTTGSSLSSSSRPASLSFTKREESLAHSSPHRRQGSRTPQPATPSSHQALPISPLPSYNQPHDGQRNSSRRSNRIEENTDSLSTMDALLAAPAVFVSTAQRAKVHESETPRRQSDARHHDKSTEKKRHRGYMESTVSSSARSLKAASRSPSSSQQQRKQQRISLVHELRERSLGDLTSLSDFMKEERNQRNFVQKCVLLEQRWLLDSLRLIVEEDQERYNTVWLAQEQAKSASHPHKFKEHRRVPSSTYAYGFVCDLCDFEFLPGGKSGKDLHFFHCNCGRDLCESCYVVYRRKCTCRECGRTMENSMAFRDHVCTKRAREETLQDSKASRSARGNRQRAHRGKETEGPEEDGRRGGDDVLTVDDVPDSDIEEDEGAGRPAAGVFNRPINVMPSGPWKPFAGLRADQQQVRTRMLPTPEERRLLLEGDWIRHFHLFPVDSDDPVAFTYHVQPGRTGAIFLSNEHSIHSAVVSVLERQMLVVDLIDTADGCDQTRAVSLVSAKSHKDLSTPFQILQDVIAYDCNMMKQRRAPGTLSVYQSPQSAYRCHGDPFVYIRWFRFNEDRTMSAFLLSNGTVQVFVGGRFELRWIDEARKFMVRANGVCEVVDEENFALAPAIHHLLYDSI